jgi:uncharacterized protein YjeT (DUF2065 family)
MEVIEIPLSKKKIILMSIGSLLFVLLGILFIIYPEKVISVKMSNEEFIRLAGILSVLFGSLTGLYGIFKIFDGKVGLTINNEGIIDNTNATSIGLIKWIDIEHIKTEQVMSTKFLLIFTRNQDEILNKVSGMKRKLMMVNAKMYGTPISITSNTLKYDYDELEKLIIFRLNTHKEKC